MTDLILGVEIGGTKLQLGLGTQDGELLTQHQAHVDVEAGGAGIRQWLVEQIPVFLENSGSSLSKLAAIGCGFGGPIDRNAGKILVSVQISGWQDFYLRIWFENTFSKRTWIENDSNAAAWAEYQKGFGRGTQHFFYTNLGSGVGGGLIINGELVDGLGFGAGEFGQTYVPDMTGKTIKPIKIEQICSGWSIESRLRQPGYIPETSELFQRMQGDVSCITAGDLADAARAGDVFALNEIDLVAHTLGIGLANVLSLTNVEHVAIGGGVSKMGAILLEPIRRYTAQYAFVSSQGRYQIELSELGDTIVLVGAILLAKTQVMAM